jgi:hypothetical protein
LSVWHRGESTNPHIVTMSIFILDYYPVLIQVENAIVKFGG